jgi:hypothetical protein
MKKILAFIFSFLMCALPVVSEAQNRLMTCKITGTIISVLKHRSSDASDMCSKHPCRALVKIVEVGDCGSSVSLPLQTEDMIELQFAYTLDNTAKIYPKMKTHYPGLKKGDMFTAFAEQRLKPGSDGEFVIFAYQKINAPHRSGSAAKRSIHRP